MRSRSVAYGQSLLAEAKLHPIAKAKIRCAPIEALGDARYEPLRDRILKPESYQAQIWHLAHATC